MTKFIENFIADGERIIYTSHLHWIYAVIGMVWCVSLASIGYVADHFLWLHFGSNAPEERHEIFYLVFGSRYPWIFWMSSFCGVWLLIIHIVKLLATEVAITGQRLIYKTGWLFVDVKEIELTEIRAEKVHHGLLGRFLRYGELSLDSRFVNDTWLPAVKQPYAFLRAIHTARAKLKDRLAE